MIKDNNTKLYKGTDGIAIAEVGTVLHEASLDLGTLCKSNNINMWAKYKPFRYGSLFFSDASSAMTAASSDTVRFGFGQTEVTMSYSWSELSPEWEANYLKPRGVTTTYNEPFRIFDFVDLTASSTNGYNHNAVPPLKITYDDGNGVLNGGNSGVMLYFNSSANASWDGDTCVSFGDLLPTTLTSYRFAVLLIWQKNGSTKKNLIVSAYGPEDVSNQGGQIAIPFAGVESNDHIFAPLISGTVVDGDTVTLKVGLVDTTGWNPSQEQLDNQWGYVYTFSADPNDPYNYLGNLVSLNFVGDMDRASLIYAGPNSIYGLTGSISAGITKTSNTYMGSRAYTLDTVTITLDKSDCIAWGDRASVNVQLFINGEPNSYGNELLYYGQSLSDSSPQNLYGIAHDATRFPEEQYDSGIDGYSVARLLNSSTSGGDYAKIVVITGTPSAQTWSLTVLNKNESDLSKKPKRAYLSINQSSGISYGQSVTISGYVYSGALDESDPEHAQGTIILLDPCTIDLSQL